jgi:hypothetical protein
VIADTLFPLLRERFADRGIRLESQPQVCAIFPAAHPEVGDIQVCDDGDEVTVYAGNFTHGHFSNYDDLPEGDKARDISESVIDFLEAVFADRVAFWGSHKTGGGWRRLDIGTQEKPKASEYVWSGPRRTI